MNPAPPANPPPLPPAVPWAERLRAVRSLWKNPHQTRKRQCLEYLLSVAPLFARRRAAAAEVRRVLVMRTNDLGDVLVITPLFEALHRLYPRAEIVACVGSWSVDLLRGNPYVHRVLTLDVPWANKFVRSRGWLSALWYALTTREIGPLRRLRCDVGVDVYGTHIGAILLLRAGVPYRLSVCRPGGGFSAAQNYVPESWDEHVGRHALRFAELLGARTLPEARPQLFLSAEERAAGEALWSGRGPERRRCAVFPGAGLAEKSWPPELLRTLCGRVGRDAEVEWLIMGGAADHARGELLAALPGARNLAGKLDLRSSMAGVAAADAVLSQSSLGMHLAGAFRKPCLVTLTRWQHFPSSEQHQVLWGYPEQRHVKLGEAEDEALLAAGAAFLREALAGAAHKFA